MNQQLTPSSLLNSYEHTLEFFDDSLLTLRALIKAQRTEQRLPDWEFLDRYEHALEAFEGSLVSLRSLIRAQRNRQRLLEGTLAQLLDQCTAAAATARRNRAV